MYLSENRHQNCSPNLVPVAKIPGSGSPPNSLCYVQCIYTQLYINETAEIITSCLISHVYWKLTDTGNLQIFTQYMYGVSSIIFSEITTKSVNYFLNCFLNFLSFLSFRLLILCYKEMNNCVLVIGSQIEI